MKNYLIVQIIIVTFTFLMTHCLVAAQKENKVTHKSTTQQEVSNFKKSLLKSNGFNESELNAWFDSAKVNQSIIDKMNKPAEKTLKWYQYRNIFIQEKRVKQGVEFWNEHSEALERAEDKYGVPAELIVGLIGVETRYGRIKGKSDVFNALYTLAFHYPRRGAFFKKELKQFLILAKQQQWKSHSIKGSYAGAMGYGQFMPSSYRMYAVDFDGDGSINLIDSPEDAIGSVANYIKVHGWKPGEAIIEHVKVSGKDFGSLKQRGLKPKLTLQNFIDAGITFENKFDLNTKALLIELEQQKSMDYWLGFHNFYVISRYNPRVFYTMAVIELSNKIAQSK